MPPNPLHARRALSAFQPTARVGAAPIFVSRDEVRTRAGTTDTAMRSFDGDLRAKLAYATSTGLADALAATDADEDERMQITLALNSTVNDVLTSRQNEQGKDQNQVDAEKAFYRGWLKLYVRWTLFFRRIQGFSLTGPSPNSAWDQIDQFDADLKSWRDKASSDFGIRVSAPVPPKPPNSWDVPWGTIIGAVAAVAIVTQLPSLLRK